MQKVEFLTWFLFYCVDSFILPTDIFILPTHIDNMRAILDLFNVKNYNFWRDCLTFCKTDFFAGTRRYWVYHEWPLTSCGLRYENVRKKMAVVAGFHKMRKIRWTLVFYYAVSDDFTVRISKINELLKRCIIFRGLFMEPSAGLLSTRARVQGFLQALYSLVASI